MSQHSALTATTPIFRRIHGLPGAATLLASIYALVCAVVTLMGWAFQLPRLTDWRNDGISMFPNTALCAGFGGLALLFLVNRAHRWQHIAAIVFAAMMALIGGLTLFQHVSGINLGIDTLLFDEPWGQRAAAAPMRMGPPASLAFLTLGTAIILATLGTQSRRVASALALLPIVIASLSLTGFWFGADQLFGVARFTGIAWQTSMVIAVLGVGLVAALPDHGIVAALNRDDAGGAVFRRLIVPIVVVPLLLGWLRIQGQTMGLFDTAFGTALRTLIEIILLFLLLWWTANGISKHALAAGHAEYALRESEMRFKTLASRAPVGIFQTGDRGNCLFVNERWCELAGMNLEEALGRGWVQALHPDDRERVASEWYQAAQDGRDFASEYRFKTPQGRETWLSGSAVPLYGKNGAVVGYIGTVNDVTERKLAEQSLRAADRRKDEFLATLAHELRNPLAPLRNAIELLKLEGADGQLFETTRQLMERQLGHLVRLVDDLLDVSRISRDKLELRKECVELASIIHHALESCLPLTNEMGHNLTVTLPDRPIYLHADPVRLTQVFGNLVNNACKYTDRDGDVWITAKRSDDEVIVTVSDNGVGMSPDTLSHVFEMFAQGDPTTEQSKSGLGIGLTLVKRLVEMHGGSVNAKSEGLECGSEFTVRLPVIVQVPTRVDVEPTSTESTFPTISRALVVDDNVDAAKTLAHLLKIRGIEVRTAHDGLAAVEVAEQFNPDAILLDIGMPKMNGYDVCRTIRDRPWGQNMAIIALTGWGQDEDRRKSKEAGFDGHLVKPVDHDALLRLLANLTNTSSSC